MPSVKDWSPDPVRDVKYYLERFTVDSSKYPNNPEQMERDESRLGGVASPVLHDPEPLFVSEHVTDDPSVVVAALNAGENLMETKRDWWPKHLCPGLFVSMAPNYWRRRVSERLFRFLPTLTPEERKTFGGAIMDVLLEQRDRKYISESEYEVGVRDVDYWITGTLSSSAVTVVDGQPYNIDLPQLARKLGIADPKEPSVERVLFTGRYLDMAEREVWDAIGDLLALVRPGNLDQADICQVLREQGWDGVFTKSGFSTEAELSIMNGSRILAFGDWKRSA